MLFELDLTSVQELEVIPDGTYVMKAKSVNYKPSQNNNTNIFWSCEVLAPSTMAGKPFLLRITATQSCLWRIRQLFIAAGVEIVPGKFSPEDVVGKEFGAIVTTGPDQNGNPRNDVAKFMKATETVPALK